MSTGIELDSSYTDLTHGSYGFLSWIMPIAFIFFFCINAINFNLLIHSTPSFTEDYFMTWFFLIMLISVLILFGSSTRYASQTVQLIHFKKRNIFIRLYFGRKISFSLNELSHLTDFKVNKLMSRIRTFPVNSIGFFIYAKNGKKYRVSPNMREFVELKKLLIEIIEKNPHYL